jgi:hypothetical protein
MQPPTALARWNASPIVEPKEEPVSALLPMLLLGSQVVLAADLLPQFDASLSCRSAGASSVMEPATGVRNAAACERDENEARGKLEQGWSGFSAAEQQRCTRLTTLGGSPRTNCKFPTAIFSASAQGFLPPALP